MPDLFHGKKIDETLDEYRKLALQLQELVANLNAGVVELGSIVRTVNAALAAKKEP